jgi:LacI family transcriptional regulator
MATLKDIAREAGVSITTVSNVIHGKRNRASQGLVEKIEGIIQRENYIPNMTARTLANKSSSIIGIINHVASVRGGRFMTDPFHNTFIGSVEDCTREKGYFVMVRTVEDPRGLETIQRNWDLSGIILAGLFQDDEFFKSVRRIGIPYVLIDSYIDLPEVYNVGLEDQKGGYIATRHLLENGHRHIAFASSGIIKNGVLDHRLEGYRQALGEAGVPFDPALVFEQGISAGEGIKLGRMFGGMGHITGIFATADILAAGIISGLRETGARVPEDKSIVGFDDNYLCELTYPRLTTVHQGIEDKGVIATEMMIGQLTGQEIRERKVILPVKLAERDSVRDLSV